VGRVVTFTAIRYPPKGFENQAPYVVAIIDIEKGPRVIGRVSNSGDEVKIGANVVLKSRREGSLEFQLSR
jgi:scaffold protein (connect acetoacetyl-CoA thiolase and HMG-CoA synthase)